MKYLSFPTSVLLIGSSIIVSAPAYANPNFLGLQDSDLKWCQAYVGMTADQIRSGKTSSTSSSSSSGWEGGLSFPDWVPVVGGVGANAGSSDRSEQTSSSSNHYNRDYSSLYVSKNCDTLLREAGAVTIADINANRDIALAKIQSDAYKYGVDAQREVGLDANYTERYKSDNDVKRTEILSRASTTNTAINAGAQVLGGVLISAINRPAQPQTTNPTVASVPSDPVSNLLAQWGWTRVGCVQGKVFIFGLLNQSDQPVCVQPNVQISAGNYRFANNQLYLITNQSSTQQLQLDGDLDTESFSSDDEFLSDDNTDTFSNDSFIEMESFGDDFNGSDDF